MRKLIDRTVDCSNTRILILSVSTTYDCHSGCMIITADATIALDLAYTEISVGNVSVRAYSVTHVCGKLVPYQGDNRMVNTNHPISR